jgi:septal ring factor EnvC (AmiA/AmiB activator)
MSIPTVRDQHAHLGGVLSVVAALAVAAPVAILFWPDNIDPQVSATLQNIRAGQKQTTSGIGAINDRPDLFIALSTRLSTLQDAMTRIKRDNAELTDQLTAIRTQMAQDNASVAAQLNALTQMMARRLGILAKGSDERERRHRTITHRLVPAVSRPEVTGALPARRPAGALFPAAGGQ